MFKRWARSAGRDNLLFMGVLLVTMAITFHLFDGPAPEVLFGFGGVGVACLCLLPFASARPNSDV